MPTSSPLTVRSLAKLINSRVKYLIAEVDLDQMHNSFLQVRNLRPTFASYVLHQIAQDLSEVLIPVCGFYFSGCQSLMLTFPNLAASLLKLIRSIKASWSVSKFPPVILLDYYGITVWDRLRDHISGIILENAVLETNGSLKIRFKYVYIIHKFDHSSLNP
jgi:hypothetical protein